MNYLKNLLQLRLLKYNLETNKWYYTFSAIKLHIDLFFVEYTMVLTYWINRQTVESKHREFNELMDSLFADFELTEVAAKKAVKKPKTAVKKKTAKK